MMPSNCDCRGDIQIHLQKKETVKKRDEQKERPKRKSENYQQQTQ